MLPAHCQPPSTFWKPVRTESGGPWLSQAVLRLVSGEACVCVSASDTGHAVQGRLPVPGGSVGTQGTQSPGAPVSVAAAPIFRTFLYPRRECIAHRSRGFGPSAKAPSCSAGQSKPFPWGGPAAPQQRVSVQSIGTAARPAAWLADGLVRGEPFFTETWLLFTN